MSDFSVTPEPLQRQAAEADRGSTCLNLKKAARATSQLLDGFLLPLGLRASQFSVLNQIFLLGTPTMTQLSDGAVMDRTTLTRSLGPLERDGLVKIVAGEDRRVRVVTLTDRGRDLLARALPLREQAEARITDSLGEERRRDLLAHLDALTRLAREP